MTEHTSNSGTSFDLPTDLNELAGLSAFFTSCLNRVQQDDTTSQRETKSAQVIEISPFIR